MSGLTEVSGVTGVSIDLGGTKLAAARFVDGEVTQQARLDTSAQAGSNAQIDSILELLSRMDCVSTDQVGVAVSGRIDTAGLWHALNSDTLSGINAVPLKETLDSRLGHSIVVMNDAVAGGLCEARFGAGKGVQAFAYITVSTGVGGVCVIDGLPMVSSNGLAGHLGFTTSRLATERCGSGRVGTVESIASGTAIQRSAAATQSKQFTTVEIFEYYREGQTWATDIIECSAQAIAELGGNLAASLGITHIVLGGGVGLADGYVACVQRAVAKEPEIFQVTVTPAAHGSNAVLVGALCTPPQFEMSD